MCHYHKTHPNRCNQATCQGSSFARYTIPTSRFTKYIVSRQVSLPHHSESHYFWWSLPGTRRKTITLELLQAAWRNYQNLSETFSISSEKLPSLPTLSSCRWLSNGLCISRMVHSASIWNYKVFISLRRDGREGKLFRFLLKRLFRFFPHSLSLSFFGWVHSNPWARKREKVFETRLRRSLFSIFTCALFDWLEIR